MPNNDVLLAFAAHFLDNWQVNIQLPHKTLVAFFMVALSFNGDHYRQVSGIAMESKMSQKYVCLFDGFV